MQIYTSYFSNKFLDLLPTHLLHAISVGLPKGTQYDKIKELAPDWNNVEAYKKGEISWAVFTQRYMAKLDKLGVNKVLSLLEDGHVYLCFEGKGINCHRHLLAEWLRRYTNVEVTEL